MDQSSPSSTTGATSPTADRRRIGLLALALAVSWASMLFHNQWELPLTPLDLENTGPLAVDIALLVACWWRPWSRVVWTVILAWGLLNMVVGGLVTVLPLPVLPFVPEQTVDHYAVHAGLRPRAAAPRARRGRGASAAASSERSGSSAEGGHDGRADG